MKTIVITGASSGIGLATAKALAGDHRIIAVCRSAARGEETVKAIRSVHPQADVMIAVADLENLNQVRDVATTIVQMCGPVDILLNNAGFYPGKIEYRNGIENTFYVSHLAHTLLTLKLKPSLDASGSPRIVNVSSAIHPLGNVKRFFTKNYGFWHVRAYADAKLANILFTRALCRHWPEIPAFTVHPGIVDSGFDRRITSSFKYLIALGRPLVFISPEKGAQTQIYLCTAPIADILPHTGRYFVKSKPARTWNSHISDENADWLWNRSLEYLHSYL